MPQKNGPKEPAESTENREYKPNPVESSRTEESKVVPSSHSSGDEERHTKKAKPKWTDVAVAFFTVCLVGVAIWQGHIFSDQLKEMHSGGTDTHDLALAAKSQADASKAQAESKKAQVEKMSESLRKTDDLIAETKVQADSTKTLAENSKTSTQLAERAWVGVQTHVLTSVSVGFPRTAPPAGAKPSSSHRNISFTVEKKRSIRPRPLGLPGIEKTSRIFRSALTCSK